jgi:hypothetical protein
MPATKKRPPVAIKPELGEEREAEGVREGEDDMPMGKPSRKRSAKGAKETKAPMDGGMYGKKPMDGEGCNCGKRKAKCDGSCGKKMDRNDALTPQEYLAACELGIQSRSRSYIRARLDAAERLDLKCGKGSISQGEKCHKGAATKAKGPSAAVQVGQGLKAVGKVGLETVKWTSGYNIGKTLATGITGGKNEKASGGSKAAAVLGSTLLSGVSGGLGAARRVGAFGLTDLQQHAKNEKKEKAWRKSVGYRDGGTYAKGFKVDYGQLGL